MSMQFQQSQTLALTPKMQQSIKVLQLSTVELMAYVQEIVLENPFLEQASVEESFSVQAVDSSSSSSSDFYESIQDPWQHYWDEFKSSQRQSSDARLSFEERFTRSKTLHEHLLEQLTQQTANKKMIKIGKYLIDLVQEDGYIREDMDNIARELGVSISSIEKVLLILQSFDPIGVCARNLPECLRIQLKELNELSADLEKVLDHLSELMTYSPKDFACKYDLDPNILRKILDRFKSLNPKPGHAFDNQDMQVYCIPDVIVGKSISGEWFCELNEGALPRVFIDRQSYLTLMDGERGGHLKVQDRQYINAHISNANWLLRSLSQRAETVLRVSCAIMLKQKDFLNRGKVALKPLNLKDIALELDVHESTVSRTVTGKFAATPFGIIELKQFFSGAIKRANINGGILASDAQQEVSNGSIQFKIKDLVEGENKKSPYSDEQIVKKLREQGIILARRTVTKYREKMKIPSSIERKNLSKILTFL